MRDFNVVLFHNIITQMWYHRILKLIQEQGNVWSLPQEVDTQQWLTAGWGPLGQIRLSPFRGNDGQQQKAQSLEPTGLGWNLYVFWVLWTCWMLWIFSNNYQDPMGMALSHSRSLAPNFFPPLVRAGCSPRTNPGYPASTSAWVLPLTWRLAREGLLRGRQVAHPLIWL